MAIEVIEKREGSMEPAREFFIHVDQTAILPSSRPMTEKEIEADWQEQQSLESPWAFMIGAQTNKIDPLLGRLPDRTIYTYLGIRRFCESLGIGISDCFYRQRYGEKYISSEVATWLDGSAIERCDFLIAAPGFADSRNTSSEIELAAQKSKPIIFLLDKNKPEKGEEEFMGWATARVSASESAIQSVTITFQDIEEMFSDLGIVLASYKQRIPIRAAELVAQ